MTKFIFRFFWLIAIILIFLIIFLTYFGLETNRFDSLIKDKASKINQNVKLDFDKIKIYIDIKKLNILVKIQKPKVIIKNNQVDISKLDLSLALKSFYNSDFLLKRADIAFKNNDIKDIEKVTSIFIPRIINKEINKIFKEGKLEGEFVIPFLPNGKISKNYKFNGKIIGMSFNIKNEFMMSNLTTKISFFEKIEEKILNIEVENGKLYGVDLNKSVLNIKKNKNFTKVESLFFTKGKIDFEKIKKISTLLNLPIDNFKDIHGIVDLNTKVNFRLNKNYKINNLKYETKGNINYLEILSYKNDLIKKYLPKHKSKTIFKDTNIKFKKSHKNQSMELEGLIKISDNFDVFSFKENYNLSKKKFSLNGKVDLTNSEVVLSKINYKKKSGKKSKLLFDINFILNKIYRVNSLKFVSDKNNINLFDIKLNKKFEIEDLKKIEVKTFLGENKNNDFKVEKINKLNILGKVFDAQPILNDLFTQNNNKIFSKNFTSDIKVNFDKTITGTDDDISNFAMVAFIKNGSYEKLSLKGNFSSNEIIEMSIYQVDNSKKTLQIISDRARPFVKSFKFIDGFEGGKLEYESIISKEISNSILKINDFKISKVPALAKLLTLASLQGIADTLNGEGIRFDLFEMKSNTKGKIFNVEDALAMGPAVSILLDGYVDKGKTVSLRGTLVPATRLNALIAKIPIVGNILVGKKSGEGVVGVSFKMKGPPKDIKTTVNPIKTLTPRFIIRAVEKMKNKNKDITK